ncbi:uncharacterized protein J4E88_001531 [Alternaria novae-zelandiae]|uniref:uncharacterized protein n=1 Tax=Alternaria novae-zelandiae TaxID=430562 RepID=UPI0020C2F978|nr:uncharacterized protein J4E88_001531 [Alternaria novae-zelandiae]KAI4693160.1 hypothetical protein J4E88_001531 [Alternaria novae-zelandiae]
MSVPVSPPSPLLRLPRELRDQIYTYTFDDAEPFVKNRAAITTSSKIALFHDLPALCQANRQLFNEATPIFLAQNLFSWNTQESKQLLDLFSHLPKDAASKRVKHISIYNWTEQGTPAHLELISKFTQLEFVEIIFSFPSIEDGVRMERFDYTNEQECYLETGLHYDLPEGRSLEEEKASLAQDVETFVAQYGLDRIIDMPKLDGMQFQFATNQGEEDAFGGNQEYRHRLCNPLWRWATKKMEEKWGADKFFVTTTMPEDYHHVNRPYVGW